MKRLFVWCLLGAVLTQAFGAPAQERKADEFYNPAAADDEFTRVFARARMLARRGRPEEAIKEFQKAAALREQRCGECFRLIGQTYMQMGRYKESAAAFRQAIALQPDNEADLQNGLGVALYLQNDKKVFAEAAAAFQRAIELSGGKVVKAHYNLGYALIKAGREKEGVAALQKYLELEPASPSAAEVRAIIANPKLAYERFAPGFEVESMSGEVVSLDRYRGKVVLLDFWATWCPPCREEMPFLKKLWKDYGGEHFVILGISLDDREETLAAYLKEQGITWPQYYDASGAVATLYGVRAIPQTVLVDQDGVVRAVGLRGSRLGSKVAELVEKLKKAR